MICKLYFQRSMEACRQDVVVTIHRGHHGKVVGANAIILGVSKCNTFFMGVKTKNILKIGY